MPGFVTRLSAGLDRAEDNLALAGVPLLFALLQTDKLLAIATFDGGHVASNSGCRCRSSRSGSS